MQNTETPINSKDKKKKYLIALSSFPGTKGFNCPTILVSAKNEIKARDIAISITGKRLGDIKEVDY